MTFSVVMPNFSKQTLPGAEAPKAETRTETKGDAARPAKSRTMATKPAKAAASRKPVAKKSPSARAKKR